MRVSGVIAATFIFMLAVWESDAQTKSMGTFFAPDRTGFSHQRFLHDGTFWNIDLAVDYGACVLRQGDRPGGRLSLGYNFIVWEKDHPEGHSRIYAGPGVSVGYVTDKDSGYGGMAGISGNAGYEYDFDFPITVSVSLSPMLGIHIHNTDRGLQLNTYINSLLWSLSPQLGIRYRVGERRNAPDRVSGADGIPEYKRKFPRLTFGVEWGYAATFLCTFHHNYRAEDRYRVNDKGTKAMYEGNGHILAHLGANLGRHYNLAFYTGYEGIADGFCVIPMTLRHTWLFGDRAENSRWLCFADAGYGLRAEGDSNCFIAKAGGGYRVSFSRSVKMDFLLTYRFAYAEIPFSDESGTVPQDRINRNNNFLNAISIGIGLTL